MLSKEYFTYYIILGILLGSIRARPAHTHAALAMGGGEGASRHLCHPAPCPASVHPQLLLTASHEAQLLLHLTRRLQHEQRIGLVRFEGELGMNVTNLVQKRAAKRREANLSAAQRRWPRF